MELAVRSTGNIYENLFTAIHLLRAIANHVSQQTISVFAIMQINCVDYVPEVRLALVLAKGKS